ncbi:HAD family hydrolase [Macrococcus animalis]|uniref:HAD family hydrolase n=1 Tax=Macrococcus animalis TaxID=3395467 RepID=UPI0039BDB81D
MKELYFIFDLDNTLYNQITPFKNAFEEVFPDVKVDIKSFFYASRVHSDLLQEQVLAGQLSMSELQVQRMALAFKDYNIAVAEEKIKEFQNRYQYCQNHLILSDTIKKMLIMIKDNCAGLGMITNGDYQHQSKKIQDLKINDYFDANTIIISGEINISKPDARIFNALQKKMKINNVNTSNIYFIGDSYINDVLGAKAVGWKTIWFKRNKDVENHQADFIVENEMQLITLIKELILKNDNNL